MSLNKGKITLETAIARLNEAKARFMRRAKSTADQAAATIIASIAAKQETEQQSATYEITTPNLSSYSIEEHIETQKGLWLCSAAPKTRVSISVDGKELATIVPKMITAASRKATIVDAKYYQKAITSAMDKFDAADKPMVEEVTVLQQPTVFNKAISPQKEVAIFKPAATPDEASATSQADDAADQAMEEGADALGFITASSRALSGGEANISRPATASSGTNLSQEEAAALEPAATPDEASATSQIDSVTNEANSSSSMLLDSDSSSESDSDESVFSTHRQLRRGEARIQPGKGPEQKPENTESAEFKEAKKYVASLLEEMNKKIKVIRRTTGKTKKQQKEEENEEKTRVSGCITLKLLQIEAELKKLGSLQHKIQKPVAALIRPDNLAKAKARIEEAKESSKNKKPSKAVNTTQHISFPSASLLEVTTALARAKTGAASKALARPLKNLTQYLERMSIEQDCEYLDDGYIDWLRTTLPKIRKDIELSLQIITEANSHNHKSALVRAFADQLRHFPPQSAPSQASEELDEIIAKELELMAVEQYLAGEITRLHSRDVPKEKEDAPTTDKARTETPDKVSVAQSYPPQQTDLDYSEARHPNRRHGTASAVPSLLGQVRSELRGAEDKKQYMTSKKRDINYALRTLGGIPPSMPYTIRQESKRTSNSLSIIKQLQRITKHLELLTRIKQKQGYPDFDETLIKELQNALNLMSKSVDKLMSMVTLKKRAIHPLLASTYTHQRYVAAAPAIPQASCPHWNDGEAIDGDNPPRKQETVPTLIPMDQQYNIKSSLRAAGRYLDEQLAVEGEIQQRR